MNVATRPEGLLRVARALLERPDAVTAGWWPRAAALLGRQALEAGVNEFWSQTAAEVGNCSMRAQLLCLRCYARDPAVAEQAYHAWSALSEKCHHHPYQLAPTSKELADLFESVERVLRDL